MHIINKSCLGALTNGIVLNIFIKVIKGPCYFGSSSAQKLDLPCNHRKTSERGILVANTNNISINFFVKTLF